MDRLPEIYSRVYFGNSVASWAEALLIFAVLLLLLPSLRLSLERRLQRLRPQQSRTALEFTLELIERTTRLFMVAVAAYFALKSLRLPTRMDRIIDTAIEFALWVQIAVWGAGAAGFLIDRRMDRVGGDQLPTLAILRFVSLLLIWALALLMLLSNLGVNVTALVTSLGVGGVAIALAVQNVLGDVLASLAIAFDKPFTIGDELHVDDIVGTVERIGIKSTRLRSIDGEQIIIANGQLLQLRLRNFGRAREQRISFTYTLAFDTPAAILRAFPDTVQQVVQTLPSARFWRCFLRGPGAAGFEYEISFYATAPQQTSLGQLREQFTLRLLEQLGPLGLAFSAPGTPVLSHQAATKSPPA